MIYNIDGMAISVKGNKDLWKNIKFKTRNNYEIYGIKFLCFL